MKISYYQTLATYDVGDGFYVDMVLDRESKYHSYEAWMFHKDYGVKQLMYGIPIDEMSFERFETSIKCSVAEHKRFYRDEVFD